MRRRHRIQDVLPTKYENGFVVYTNGGSVTFMVGKYITQKLRHHLPHMCKEIEESGSLDAKKLIGKYIYGASVIREDGEMLTRVLR